MHVFVNWHVYAVLSTSEIIHVFVNWHVYTVLSTSEIMYVFVKSYLHQKSCVFVKWHIYTVLSTSEIIHVFVKWHVYTVLSTSEIMCFCKVTRLHSLIYIRNHVCFCKVTRLHSLVYIRNHACFCKVTRLHSLVYIRNHVCFCKLTRLHSLIFFISTHNLTGLIKYAKRGRPGHGSMVVGFTTTCAISAYHHWRWVRIPLRRCVLHTTLCDKDCQWLATGRWFSLGNPVSSTNKTDRHDITEILLKVALNTIFSSKYTKQPYVLFQFEFKSRSICILRDI